MAIRIDHPNILASWRNGFLADVKKIKEEEAENAAKAVRRRVLDLAVNMSIAVDQKDFETVRDVLLQVKFDAAIPPPGPGPAVERIYIWRHGHLEACSANYGEACDCAAQGRVG